MKKVITISREFGSGGRTMYRADCWTGKRAVGIDQYEAVTEHLGNLWISLHFLLHSDTMS